MRNLSKENQRHLYRFQPSTLRSCTSQKRLSSCKKLLKETQVRVGNYKFSIEDVLGKGYSSKVYKGVQIGKEHKKYAIKAVDMKKFRGSNLDMLEAQIQIHQELDHQNIIKCYEVIRTPHHYYMILEYCPHGNLMDHINQKKKIGENMALEIMHQISSAYKYLLDEGIIHRDLKPANILRVGNKWKLADFGFSVKSRFEFKDRINVGTPLYMPLEALNRNYYSFKTDVFALGIILYEMLTGHTPWQCRTEQQLLQKMRQDQIHFPNQIKSSISKNFIVKACQLQDSKRFSVDEFKQYQFKNCDNSSVAQSRAKNSLSSCLSSSNLKSNIKSFRSSGATEQSSSKSTEESQKQNAQALKNELQLCRLLYYMVVNIESFLMDHRSRQIFILTVYKHMMRLVKILENRKVNSFNLKSWEKFKNSKTYNSLVLQFSEYSIRYEKEYLDYIKNIDIASIRAVNRRFPELSHSCPLSKKFYDQLKQYVKIVIRQQNHEISLIHSKKLKDYEDKIQALDCLHQYYKAIDTKLLHLESSQIQGPIQMERIRLIENYHQTKYTSIDYLNLRKILKSV